MVIFSLILVITVNAVTPIKVGSYRLYAMMLIIALVLFPIQFHSTFLLFNGYLVHSPITIVLTCLCLLVTLYTCFTFSHLHINGPMLLLCCIGSLLLIQSYHLFTMILAIELQSFTAYLLVSTSANLPDYEQEAHQEIELDNKVMDTPSTEQTVSASMRYLILGAMASSIILLALGLIYTTTGTLDYLSLLELSSGHSYTLKAAYIMLLVGTAFKLGLAPLHQWTPIVYGSVNNNAIAFISIVPKLGMLALLSQLLSSLVPLSLVFFFAGLSMVVGSIGGLSQSHYRPLIAYSSIAHMGYMTVSACFSDHSTLILYVTQYVLTTIATLTCLQAIDTQRTGLITSINGQLLTQPIACSFLVLFLFSLAGIPPLAGFTAKLEVFTGLLLTNSLFITFIAIITTTIGAFYYLRLISLIYATQQTDSFKVKSTVQPLVYMLSIILCFALGFSLENVVIQQSLNMTYGLYN